MNQSTTERLNSALELARADNAERNPLGSYEQALCEFAITIALKANTGPMQSAINQAREAGIDDNALSDVVMQLAAYFGFAGVQAAAAALDNSNQLMPTATSTAIADASDHTARYAFGIQKYGELNPVALDNIRAAFGSVAGHLIDATFSSFGDTFGASALDVRHKQMVTVAALAAAANAAPQLQFHIGAALNVGVTEADIINIMLLVQTHAGMPAAYNGMIGAKAAFAAGDSASPGYR